MNIDKLLILLLCSLTLTLIAILAQPLLAEEYRVYEKNEYGFISPLPSKTVEVNKNTINVYEHGVAGVKNPFPSQQIVVERDRPATTNIPTSLQPTTPLGQLLLDYQSPE